ncbi:MAG: threonine/serine exporter family protein [Flavobacteriaceae bacterium]|jgi:uncharacterized membrane protein YjjB (DUF3815 family)|nr:threonine/serine exporter family protein [Flavobacteriaceae bacterium]
MDFISFFTDTASAPLWEKIFWSMWVSVGFSVLFNTPRRSMWVVAVLGIVGYSCRALLMTVLVDQIVFSTFVGASVVGVLGVYFAHKVHTPPIVFTIPAVINMIPGKNGYEFMVSLIQVMSMKEGEIMQFADLFDVVEKGIRTGFILLSLASGVAFPLLIFRTQTVKTTDLNLINKLLNYKRK